MEPSKFLDLLEGVLSQSDNVDFRREGLAISVNTEKKDHPELWLSFANDKELYIGIENCNQLFYNKEESWKKGMVEYLNMLSSPITLQIFKKKDFPYKFSYTYLDQNNSKSHFTSMSWLYQYWRKSVVECVTFPSIVSEKILSKISNSLINAA